MTQIVSSTKFISEGKAISFLLTPAANRLHVWQVYNTGIGNPIQASDFTGGRLIGTVMGSGGKLSIILTIANDNLLEGDETFKIRIFNPNVTPAMVSNGYAQDVIAESDLITISDIVQSGTITSPTSAVEGTNIKVDINTFNVVPNTLLAWKVVSDNMNLADFSMSSLTGTIGVKANTAVAGGNSGIASISIPVRADFTAEGNESFRVQFFRPGIALSQVNAGTQQPWITSSEILVADLIQTGTTSVSKTSLSEGDGVTATINTTNVTDNTSIPWKVEGTGITTADFMMPTVSGSTAIVKNTARVNFTLSKDFITEGNETFKVVFYKPGSTAAQLSAGTASVFAETPSITVADAVQTIQIQQLTSTTITEGQRMSFGVKTVNVADKTTLVWRAIGSISAEDFTDKKLDGVITISQGAATLSRELFNDGISETGENFKICVYRPGVTLAQAQAGAVPWAEWPSVTVQDLVQTATIAVGSTVDEGQLLTFRGTTTNVPDGTVIAYRLSGNGLSVNDLLDKRMSGTTTVLKNTFSVSTRPVADKVSESGENIKLTVFRPGVSLATAMGGTITPWAESLSVALVDK